MTVVFSVVLLLTLALWVGTVATLSQANHSDQAGNALSQGFGAVFTVGLWVLLAVLLILAGSRGQMPGWSVVLAVVLVPASGVAAVVAGNVLAMDPSVKWPLVVPALAAPLIAAFACWAAFPAWQSAVSARAVGIPIWGAVLLLSVAPWPQRAQSMRARAAHNEQLQKAAEANRARWALLAPDARLAELAPFLTVDNEFEGQALKRIQQDPRRQADAEQMLERGDFPLHYIGSMELEFTPQFCEKARGALQRRAAALVPQGKQSFEAVSKDFDDAITAMQWISPKCDVREAATAFEKAANAYGDGPGRAWDLIALRQLREGKIE